MKSVGKDAVIGKRFGSYVVEALIGAGGMGAVYRAVQPEIGKQVAIKFLSAQLSAHPELVQRFFAEARSVNLIQHDNIVDIFDFGSGNGVSWFVMELLRGKSLTAVLAYEGRVSVPRTVDICAQVADAIAAAHGRGIIHRDLKGDNIFLVSIGGRGDFVKILDFGIAKLSDPGSLGGAAPYSHTQTGAILGTPGYMSPEQGTGGTVDGRTDIYALGVIAYRMLVGKLPHEGINHLEIVQKQLTRDPLPLLQLRPDMPAPLADLVHQMLARAPEARPQKMQEVRDRLRAIVPLLEGRPPSQKFAVESATMPSAATTLSSASGQVRTREALLAAGIGRRSFGPILAAAGGVAVIAAVVVGALLWPRHPAPVVAPPPPANLPTVATAPPAKVEAPKSGFDCLVETDPPGAAVLRGGKLLGETPVTLRLKDDPTTVTVRLAGYGDEDLEVARDTEHAIIRLHKLVVPVPPRPAKPAAAAKPAVLILPKAPPPKKKPAIGLDD
jgi:eukaryotic-like serine/threonine-protein kinase